MTKMVGKFSSKIIKFFLEMKMGTSVLEILEATCVRTPRLWSQSDVQRILRIGFRNRVAKVTVRFFDHKILCVFHSDDISQNVLCSRWCSLAYPLNFQFCPRFKATVLHQFQSCWYDQIVKKYLLFMKNSKIHIWSTFRQHLLPKCCLRGPNVEK